MADNEDEAPSWLSEDPTPKSSEKPKSSQMYEESPKPSQDLSPRSTPSASSPTPSDSANEEDDSKLASVIMSMRLLNLGMAAAMITHAILTLLRFASLGQFVLAMYAICSGCLICLLETQLKFIRTPIAINFGFLFDPALRFMYYIIIASLEWSFCDLLGKIVAGVIVGAAIYNTFVMFKFPKYRKKRDELAKLEDSRIQQKIRKKVQEEATAAMFTGK